MDEQVPMSQEPQIPQVPRPDFTAMRQQAMQQAIAEFEQQKLIAQNEKSTQQYPQPQMTATPTQQQVVYVRRNLTLAELLITLVIACGIVLGGQFTWHIFTDILPRIEIKEK